MLNLGKNVTGDFTKDGKLHLIIDPNQDYGKSASGKTTIIATTSGAANVAGPKGQLSINLNIYTK